MKEFDLRTHTQKKKSFRNQIVFTISRLIYRDTPVSRTAIRLTAVVLPVRVQKLPFLHRTNHRACCLEIVAILLLIGSTSGVSTLVIGSRSGVSTIVIDSRSEVSTLVITLHTREIFSKSDCIYHFPIDLE